MTVAAPGVTVGGLLERRPEAFGFEFEFLAGNSGLDRRTSSPNLQNTGLALAIDDAPDSGEEA